MFNILTTIILLVCAIPMVLLFIGFTVGFMIIEGCLWTVPIVIVVLIAMIIIKERRT